jgi:hypothetical protein
VSDFVPNSVAWSMKQLPLTYFARNQNMLSHMLENEPYMPINVTKHGRTLCIAMSQDCYLKLMKNAET